jgi:hypothetical protein
MIGLFKSYLSAICDSCAISSINLNSTCQRLIAGWDHMHDMWSRVGENLVARVSGPMKFRGVLQPLVASFFAIRSGLEDAKAGKPPYFWALLSEPGQRVKMIKDGWKSVGKVFIIAIVLDVIYQIIVLRFLYPGEAIIVALVLAIVPYLCLRGLVTRLARHLKGELKRRSENSHFRKAS